MPNRKPKRKPSAQRQPTLLDHEQFLEHQALVKRLVEDAKKQVDLMLWDYPLTFPITGPFGRLVCVYDQTYTIEAVIESLEVLDRYKGKVDRESYSYRISTLLNFIFWRKMFDTLQELTWEVSELIMHEDIFEGFSAYEALAGRQRIPPSFLNTSKFIADTLRKQRWTATISKGMRGIDRKQRKRRFIATPVHEINRLKILAAIKRVRSMPDEKQEDLLNNKTRLAKEAGISYHALRRSETQGNWDGGGPNCRAYVWTFCSQTAVWQVTQWKWT